MTDDDPRTILARSSMGRLQVAAVALCLLLNALDGFDVLAISFASPGIAAEWGIDRTALGIVLSMELIGMAIGSVVLGNLADRVGRRPMILGCLAIMAGGMGMATLANNVGTLSIIRLVTGFGIGGMIACISTMVAELSNARHRNLAVTLMAAGYPFGAIVGGSAASLWLAVGGWRDVFTFGAIVTAVFLPVTWFLLPESVGFLVQKRPGNALERVNSTLRRMGHTTISHLPPAVLAAPKTSLAQLFSPSLRRTTILLTIAYFAHMITFYFILKWVPKIVVDMGYDPSAAGGVLVWANVGGLAGSILFSILTYRVPIRMLVIATMIGSTALVTWFGQGQSDLASLSLIAAVAGACTNAAVVGLYAIFAQAFPTAVRAGGTGLVIGVGRGGSALGPMLAGFLFTSGFGLPLVAFLMGLSSLIAASALSGLRLRKEEAV